MASVFEAFGWKVKSVNTPVTQLGINNEVNSLQIKSQDYFTIPEVATAKDGHVVIGLEVKGGVSVLVVNGDASVLAVRIRTPFDLNEHQKFVEASTALFIKKRDALKALDMQIAGSAVLSLVTSCLSFFPFVSYFGILSTTLLIYQISQRPKAVEEYQESLNLLVGTCNWSLGPKPTSSQADKLTNDDTIRGMMMALYPVLTQEQVKHLIADDIEDIFTREQERVENQTNANSFFGHNSLASSKRSAEFNRCIYGYNKGKTTDFIDAFLSIFPDIYNAIAHGFKQLQDRWNSPASASSSAL